LQIQPVIFADRSLNAAWLLDFSLVKKTLYSFTVFYSKIASEKNSSLLAQNSLAGEDGGNQPDFSAYHYFSEVIKTIPRPAPGLFTE